MEDTPESYTSLMGVYVISYNLKDGEPKRYEAVLDALKSIATAEDVWHDREVLDSVALVVTDDSPEELSVHLEDTFTLDDSWAAFDITNSPFFAHSPGTLNAWLDSHLPPLRRS